MKFKISIIIVAIFALFYANFSVFASNSTLESTKIAALDVLAEDSEVQLTSDEREMFNLVNAARVERGLPPYQLDAELVKLARLKAEDMVEHGYFAHISPTFGSPFEMMKNFGVIYNSAGENIAENRTVAGAHSALMLSDSHRANVLSERFGKVGIGIVSGPREFKTMVQMFIEPIE